jgi:hypothetical protein
VFNKALLGKWLRRFVNDRESWWRIVMDAKFGSEWGGWFSIDTSRPHGVGLWKNIRKGWRLFFSHVKFDLGDGANIRFWDDVWCGGSSLKVAFSGIYNLASVKDASIAVNIDYLSGSLQWNFFFFDK